jgi:cyclophilin family peptidyl-prolyl cis-trans isomerase
LGPTDQQIVLALDGTRAPISTRNFLAYVNSGFYDGIIFHRVDTSNGVVQAGGFVGGLQSKAAERAAIPLESANGLSNLRGTLGMARTSAPGSATSQFYFNVRDNLGFDYQSDAAPGFAVFGRVTDGLAVIDRMAEAQVATLPVIGSDGKPIVDSSGRPVSLSNVPVQDITIRSAIQTR